MQSQSAFSVLDETVRVLHLCPLAGTGVYSDLSAGRGQTYAGQVNRLHGTVLQALDSVLAAQEFYLSKKEVSDQRGQGQGASRVINSHAGSLE